MGHERIQFLPKSRRWRDIVYQVESFYQSETEISEIVSNTLKNIQPRFQKLHFDKGVLAAFQFLITISVAARSQKPIEELSDYGINIPENITPFTIACALNDYMSDKIDSYEYGQIAQSAASDAIAHWFYINKSDQSKLFGESNPYHDVWYKASTGSGFCELARIYFAKFTERYLNYFLDREASSVITNISDRDLFKEQLNSHLDKLSKHAFETSKITQSFAAGWFNKNTKEGIPSEQQTRAFLEHAFGKLRDELRREDDLDG